MQTFDNEINFIACFAGRKILILKIRFHMSWQSEGFKDLVQKTDQVENTRVSRHVVDSCVDLQHQFPFLGLDNRTDQFMTKKEPAATDLFYNKGGICFIGFCWTLRWKDQGVKTYRVISCREVILEKSDPAFRQTASAGTSRWVVLVQHQHFLDKLCGDLHHIHPRFDVIVFHPDRKSTRLNSVN